MKVNEFYYYGLLNLKVAEVMLLQGQSNKSIENIGCIWRRMYILKIINAQLAIGIE